MHAAEDGSGGGDLVPRLFDDLVRVETRLYNALTGRLREVCGITASQYEFLAYLGEHADARVGDLATRFAVGVGAASKGVDRLAAAGWVARTADPSDGRPHLLSLTASGEALVARARTAADDLLGRLLRVPASLDLLETVGAVLHDVRRSLEAGGVGRPVG